MKADFDIASKHYDENFTFSNIGKAQRHLVFKHLDPLIRTTEKFSILELNCGTGEDAIELANSGHSVLATDISDGMIAIAKAKTHSKDLKFKIQDINAITKTSFDRKFDLIFSNFGGMNCLSRKQLDTFLKTSIDLLNPKGKLVMVLMPKHCLWEYLYFLLKGDLKKAKRRSTTEAVLVNVDGNLVETWYYNPEDIVSLTQSIYAAKIIKPVGVTIPPSYLERSFLAKTPFLNLFVKIDHIITGSFWAKYADHFLIQLIKK